MEGLYGRGPTCELHGSCIIRRPKERRGPLLNSTILYKTDLSLSERYMELLKESKIRGYIFEQQNYVPKDEPSA